MRLDTSPYLNNIIELAFDASGLHQDYFCQEISLASSGTDALG
jgi:hypothetical protein